ncbi:hypothetical protein QE250_15210 [Chromatiaceae bacterium AAb-1]|nr:hypothetical protein [Chromatiaceae bacterium AAb-1]
MLLTLIITLIVALIIITIIVNAIQQHKERLAALKRAEYSKLRAILEDTEDMLLNAANVPLTQIITSVLLKRMAYTLRAMTELEPSSKDLKHRLNEIESRLKESLSEAFPAVENLPLPDNDQQLITMIKGIKKLRSILRAEHVRGNIDTHHVVQEDRRLETLQLRINVESHIKRGNQARTNNMLGSARQYFERAMASLNSAPFQNDYTVGRKSDVIQALEDIATLLKEGNLRDREKREEKENKDLDELFAPKRKW